MVKPVLGTVAASELLIRDLYIDLRRKTREWAQITHQTAQARMGYIGQHLVSVVTGFYGGRSGARGDDLVLGNGDVAEIKTCYRVDQLGKCIDCKGGVAPDELVCATCGSTRITRKDDSKWLLSFRTPEEFSEFLEPKAYYLVLFDFVDLQKPDTIQASIWQVDPRVPGFCLAMVDYYFNIRENSDSKAPFNLWPYALKFELMKPVLIYRSFIRPDDSIATTIFPSKEAGVKPPTVESLKLAAHTRREVTEDEWIQVADDCGLAARTKKEAFALLIDGLAHGILRSEQLADVIARVHYEPCVAPHLGKLPSAVAKAVTLALKPPRR